MRRILYRILPLLLLSVCVTRAYGELALFMEEPYGEFGAFNPTGHAAVYLSNICSESPTVLRSCHDGELGVVISRYHKIDGYDWIAVPLLSYLYAVDEVSDVPATVTPQQETALRDAYRRKHLESIAPDNADGTMPGGEWTQLIGGSYIRKIYGFSVKTTPDQDDAFISFYNDRRNHGHFNLLFHNCADFAVAVVDFYFPHSLHRNFVADVGVTTPKQIGKSFVKYGKDHPELDFSVFIIPQVPGTVPRSKKIDGVVESVVKSKKYILPIAVLNPLVAGGLIVVWASDGRFTPPKNAETLTPATITDLSKSDDAAPPASQPAHQPMAQPTSAPAPQTPPAPAQQPLTPPVPAQQPSPN